MVMQKKTTSGTNNSFPSVNILQLFNKWNEKEQLSVAFQHEKRMWKLFLHFYSTFQRLKTDEKHDSDFQSYTFYANHIFIYG